MSIKRALPPFTKRNTVFHKIASVGLLAATAFGFFVYGAIFARVFPALAPVLIAPVAIFALIAIWALPKTQAAPRRMIEFFLYTYSVALVVWPNYLAVALPGLPWITVIRLVGIPQFLLILFACSTSIDARKDLIATLNQSPVTWIALVSFVLIQAASISFSTSKGESIGKFIIDQINWTAIFFISCYVFSFPANLLKWSKVMIGTAVALSIIGVAEFHVKHVMWASHIPSFLKINDPSVMMTLNASDRFGIYRAKSTFGTPLTFSEFNTIIFPFSLFFVVFSKEMWPRLSSVISSAVIIMGILASGSRSGLLGVGITCLLYLFIWAYWRRKTKHGMLASTVLYAYPLIFVVAISLSLFVGRIRRKIWGGSEHIQSNTARAVQYKLGLPKVLTHPFGHGVGRAAEVLGYTAPNGMLSIDTYYLMLALDYGVVGIIAYYAFLLSALYKAGTLILNISNASVNYQILLPCGAAIINFVVMNSVFSQMDNHPLIFMIVGAVLGCSLGLSKASNISLQMEKVGGLPDR